MTGGLARSQQILELYNLNKDPEERINVAKMRYDVVLRLKNIALNYYRHVQFFCRHYSLLIRSYSQVYDTSQVYGPANNQPGITLQKEVPGVN